MGKRVRARDSQGYLPAIITPMTPEGKRNAAAFGEAMACDIRAGEPG